MTPFSSFFSSLTLFSSFKFLSEARRLLRIRRDLSGLSEVVERAFEGGLNLGVAGGTQMGTAFFSGRLCRHETGEHIVTPGGEGLRECGFQALPGFLAYFEIPGIAHEGRSQNMVVEHRLQIGLGTFVRMGLHLYVEIGEVVQLTGQRRRTGIGGAIAGPKLENCNRGKNER